MSFRIDHLQESRTDPIGREHSRPPELADRGDLLWYYFPGDISISSGGVNVITSVGSVPALHFMAAMVEARGALGGGGKDRYVYSFTEAAEELTLQRDGDSVAIESSVSDEILVVSIDEFFSEVCAFVRREINELGSTYPLLLEHSFVRDLLLKCNELSADGSATL